MGIVAFLVFQIAKRNPFSLINIIP